LDLFNDFLCEEEEAELTFLEATLCAFKGVNVLSETNVALVTLVGLDFFLRGLVLVPSVFLPLSQPAGDAVSK